MKLYLTPDRVSMRQGDGATLKKLSRMLEQHKETMTTLKSLQDLRPTPEILANELGNRLFRIAHVTPALVHGVRAPAPRRRDILNAVGRMPTAVRGLVKQSNGFKVALALSR